MARVKIVGFETGDMSETGAASGNTADGTVFNDAGGKGGAYSAKFTATTQTDNISISGSNGINLSRVFFKTYFRFDNDAAPVTANLQYVICHVADLNFVTDTCDITLVQQTNGTWFLNVNPGGNSANLTIAKNTWYRFDVDLTVGAGTGSVNVYLDGTLIFSASSVNFGANNVANCIIGPIFFAGSDGTSRNRWYDDVEIDDAALCGQGYVIARQFKSGGTPTYDAWTKTTGAIDANWDDTPFSATNNASSFTASAAQTALLSSFSATQAGHGNGFIASGDTINSIKVGLVGKTSATTATGITEVGAAQSGSSTAGGNITLTFSVAPQTGDVVLVFGGFGTAGASNPGISTSGYNNIFADNATATRRFGVWYKVMGATPDTTVVCLGSGTAGDGVGYVSIVLRQINNSVVTDVAITSATGSSTNPNPPASGATVTANTLVLAAACSAVNDTSKGTQTNYTQEKDASANATRPYSVALSSRAIAASGTNEDPPAWSSWSTGAWEAVTVTIRPAVDAGSFASIRRRLNNSDTDTTITLTTSDAYFETSVFTGTLANLNSGEAGAVHGTNSLTTTVEDVWAMASFTPSAVTFFHNQEPIVPQYITKPEMVGY